MQQDPATLSFPGCSICFEPLDGHTNGGLAAIKCGHVYHEACLSLWSNTHNSCPQCKQSGAKRATRLYYQAETAADDAAADAAFGAAAAAAAATTAAAPICLDGTDVVAAPQAAAAAAAASAETLQLRQRLAAQDATLLRLAELRGEERAVAAAAAAAAAARAAEAEAAEAAARAELAAARGALNAAEIERIKKRTSVLSAAVMLDARAQDKELLRERRRSERLASDIGALRQRQQQDGYLRAFVDAVGAGDASLDLKFTQATANIMAGGKSWSTFASEQHKMLSYQQGEYKKLFKTNLTLEQQKLELTAAKEEADYQVKSLTQQLKQASHRLRQEQEKLQEHIAEARRRTAAVAPGPTTWGVLPQKRPSDDAENAPLFAKPAAKALKRSSSSSSSSGGIGAAAAAALSIRPSAQDASGGGGGGGANVARAQQRYQSHVNNLQPAKGAATKAPAAAKSTFSGVAQRAQNLLVPNMFATSAMYAKKAPSKQPAAFLRAHGL
ncbi:hypothetical protein JKP88DRAFT_268289 [Tribonema minus]|uniref:RING-type domain-containing protein n=1 Tax=Tribonema minus TaxID=303371 RepID=A0A835Z1I2_9STRA|nr:hypothetical protein JKP88DRAFT_268289 [Tribonema minus]